MKLLISCLKCFQEFGRSPIELCHIEFCDHGRYEITYSCGHENVMVLQQQKFEVLFDIGAYAILDGYYREAVSSFASSLERFYEFSVRVLFKSSSSSEELFQNCWKMVSKQSERQLGAFIFLWTYCLGETPKLLSDDQVNLRNNVIHNGKIPTREEAVQYGNALLKLVRPKMRLLQEKFSNEVRDVTFDYLDNKLSKEDKLAKAETGKLVDTLSITTIISLSYREESHHQKTLEESLINLSERRDRMTNM